MKALMIIIVLTGLLYQFYLADECSKKGGHYQISTTYCFADRALIQ